MKDKTEKAFQILLDEFDFNTVHKIMKHLKWFWANCNGVPSIPDMKKHITNMFNDAIKECFFQKSNQMTISSGGFEFYISNPEDNDVFMQLNFIPVDYDISISEINMEEKQNEN